MSEMRQTAKGKSTEEFEKLFNFFSRLASKDKNAFVPQEFEDLLDVIPISPSLSSRSIRSTFSSDVTSASSDAVLSDPDTVSDDEGEYNRASQRASIDYNKALRSVARGRTPHRGVRPTRFPLRGEHKFTFKIMLHDLYDVDDFASMVQDVLESSRKTYKPLPDELKPKQHSRDSLFGSGNSGELDEGRKSKEKGFPKSLGLGMPSGVSERAMKKRCVGRIRSSSGPEKREHEWISDVGGADLNFKQLKIDTSKNPYPAYGKSSNYSAASRNSPRSRKPSCPPRTRAVSGVRRAPIFTETKEAPIVKFAERFLSIPGEKSARKERKMEMGLRRVRRDEGEGLGLVLSAPSTRLSSCFGDALVDETATTPTTSVRRNMKRRLST